MTKRSNSDDLELLAYVDGFLDGDPIRKAEIERRLASSDEALEAFRVFETQNNALRRIGRAYLDEPVPPRLLRALDRPRGLRAGTVKRTAAVISLICVTTAIGWFVGQHEAEREWTPRASIEKAYENYFAEELGSLPGINRKVRQAAEAEGVFAERLSMIFNVPNMSKYGYSLVDRHFVKDTNGGVMRLTYRSQGGEDFSLFVRARWKEEGASIQVDNDGDISVAYWLDGPLASAVVSELPPDRMRAIAESVRTELRSQNMPMPAQSAQSGGEKKAEKGKSRRRIKHAPGRSTIQIPETADQTIVELPVQKPL